MVNYDENFFNDIEIGSYKSAGQILPLIFNKFKIEKVIDIGCGGGYG